MWRLKHSLQHDKFRTKFRAMNRVVHCSIWCYLQVMDAWRSKLGTGVLLTGVRFSVEYLWVFQCAPQPRAQFELGIWNKLEYKRSSCRFVVQTHVLLLASRRASVPLGTIGSRPAPLFGTFVVQQWLRFQRGISTCSRYAQTQIYIPSDGLFMLEQIPFSYVHYTKSNLESGSNVAFINPHTHMASQFVAQQQRVGLGIERFRVGNSLVSSGFSLRQGN